MSAILVIIQNDHPAVSRHPSFKRRGAYWGIVIFGVAFALRLFHIWQIRRSPFFSILLGDARGYDEWAQRIAAGDWIGHEVFYQAPLYPYFLALIYRIAGHNLMLARVAQAAIGSCSCVLVAAAAGRFFSARAGLVAGLMLGFYAPAIFFDGLLQKSVLDVFFVSLTLWLIAEITDRSRNWAWLGLGLALGGLSLTRENALICVIIVGGWAVMHFGVRPAAVLALGIAVPLLPVAIRNSFAGGGFYLTTSQFGTNFFIGNHPGADGSYQSLRYGRGAPEYERQDATELAEHELNRRLTPAEVSTFWTDRAITFITSEPALWLKLMGRKVALLFNATEIADTEDQESYAEWSTVLRLLGPVMQFGVLVPLAFIGIVATWSRRSEVGIVLALLVGYSGSVLLFYVFARYRYPMVPMLLLFVGAGIVETRWQLARAWLLPRVAAVAAVALFTNWPMGSQKDMRAITENNLATAFEADHRLDEAIVHYRNAIAADPNYSPAYSNLGKTLREQNRADEAIAAYKQAILLQPNFPAAQYNLANLLLEKGDSSGAIDHFERAIRQEPAAADMHNNYGIALASAGRIDEASGQFRQAVDLDPASAAAYRNLGDSLLSEGRSDESIAALRRAANLSPNDAAIRYDLASTLLDAGRLDEAISEFRTTVRLEPSQAVAHNNLGIALGSEGKLDEAITEFQQALTLQPGFADAQHNLAMARTARRSGLK